MGGKIAILLLLLLSYNQTVFSQCPDGQTEITILMDNEDFPGDNGWVLWDATASVEVICETTWVNGNSVSACVTNGNNLELYTYENFGDAWNGGTLTVTTSEDATAYTDGCKANMGLELFNGTDLVVDNNGDPVCGTDPTGTGNLLTSISTSCILCVITCPADIVVSVDPGLCGANVTIPIPADNGACNPNPVDMSGFYPVGTTEVIFEADATGTLVNCSMFVTVLDEELPNIDGPSDQVISLGGGECSSIFNYLITADDGACGGQPITLSHSVDQVTVDNSVACPGGSNSYYRHFDMQTEGVLTDLVVTDIEFGVFQSFGSPTVFAKIYELNGVLSLNNLTLVAENTIVLPNMFNTVTSIPISATLDPQKEYVFEIMTPGSIYSGFVMGANGGGESASSYFSSSFCGINDVITFASIGFPGMHLVMNVLGLQTAVNVDQTSGLSPGSEFPIGTTTNDFIVTDASGNTSTFSFDIVVNEFPDPINTLACNNLVNVSLDVNCEGIITPDMVLEGGPYGCYDNYTVIIKDEDDNVYGDVITGDMVGLKLIVEIHDPNGNICWGDIVIEDKLGPQLECSTRTTQCTESTDPGAPLSNLIRITESPNTTLSSGSPYILDVPFDVVGFDGASITDINLELEITHSWISDLSIVLVSPQGTIIPVFTTNCIGANMDITLDDEAVEKIDTICSFDDPAVTGDYKPVNPLSVFDGEDPNGTWVLRITDFFNGDGGFLRSFTLEMSQTGGIVGLPIPAGATYTDIGNQAFSVNGLDPCGPAILSYTDEVNNMDCTSPYTKVIYRTYSATDASGNTAISCVDTINVVRTDLGTLELPDHFDGLAGNNNAIDCTSGYPYPTVTGSPTGYFCENVQMDYEDIVIDICEGSYKVLRYWTIFEWCTSEIVEYTQIIKVIDHTGPQLECPVINDVISTSPSTCTASLLIPAPTLVDACTATPTYTVEVSSGTLGTIGSNYTLDNLEVGTHTVTYTAYDDCGNSSTCSFDFVVEDLVSPVAVCDEHTTVSLSFDDCVLVYAETFDDGSHDECSDVTWSARRMGTSFYGSSVEFCCSDVGNTIMVEFRVEDASGNYNTCMVEVEVNDKIAPAIEVPGPTNLECHEDYTDLSLTGGPAIGYDNCEIDTVFYYDIPSIGSCGSGQVTRQWTVRDKSGNEVKGTQFIYLKNNTPFDGNSIGFPGKKVLYSCDDSTDPSATGVPAIYDDICSQVAYTYWDDEFVIVDEACTVIYRKWTVIDQCQYTGSNGVGIWEFIQEIEMVNNVAPTFTSSCADITVDAYGSCNGVVSLGVEATDDCTAADKLTYSWKIDEFNTNDGIYEYENNLSNAQSFTQTFEVGTHRIVWTVLDNCGNLDVCEYLFTVEDAKKPTPYCIASLSTAVMNTNGEVTIWASDFDLGPTDNCTSQSDLIASLSFEENSYVPSRTFSCDEGDMPNGIAMLFDDIKIWVTDEAGNKDYCTVSLLVEDNEANYCEDIGSVTASGLLTTADDEVIKNVVITATNVLGDIVESNTGDNGIFSFDLIPSFDYDITAEKNTGILNGITTLDIVLIQKHILGISVFNSPYQTIAADANNNGKISGSDIISIRKLILGFNVQFPNDQESWRFVDKSAVFQDVFNVFPYDEVVDFEFTSGNMLNNDFYGIKIGDINGSVNLSGLNSEIDTRSDDNLELIIDNVDFEVGQTIEIPVFATNFDEMIAYQTTVGFDVNQVMIKDVKPGVLEITDNNFNMTQLDLGLFSMAWDSYSPVTTDEALFTLVVVTKKAGNLKNLFQVNNRITASVAYNENHVETGIEIKVRDDNEVLDNEFDFVLYPNSPNPFAGTTTVSFDLPSDEIASLKIYNVNGTLINAIEGDMKAGFNTIEVSRDMLKASGVYYYTLTAGNDSSNGKMILIE